jgi:hypothetical protein
MYGAASMPLQANCCRTSVVGRVDLKRAVAVFLKNNAGVPYCDECVRSALRISRTVLNEKGMAENADRLGLVRDWDICRSCGGRRVTTKA